MDGEWQLGSFPSPFNHAADAHASEWLSTLVDEHIGGLGPFALQALEPSKFVAFEKWTLSVLPFSLRTAMVRFEVEIIPTQVTGFAHTQAVPVDQQSDQPIPMTVPVRLQGGEQLGHLGFGEVFTRSISLV